MVKMEMSVFILASGKGIQNATVDYIPKTFKIRIFCGSQGYREKQNCSFTVVPKSLVLNRTSCFSAAKLLLVLKISIHHFFSPFAVHVPVLGLHGKV